MKKKSLVVLGIVMVVSLSSVMASFASGMTGQQNLENQIGLERAKQIVLEKVSGATIITCELDYEDGRIVYEGKAYKDAVEYEFEIDAVTGRILDWEMDID